MPTSLNAAADDAESVNATRTKLLHAVFRLDYGGMENGLVNLINGLPEDRFEHAVMCLTHATEFAERIRVPGVEILELNKPPGNDLRTYRRAFRAMRKLQPDIVHTRNFGTLDLSWVARLAGCRRRVHSEHGWSAADPTGQSRKHRFVRRACDPAVHRYVTVSEDIARWLDTTIGIEPGKILCLHNGVDLSRFGSSGNPQSDDDRITFGTLGRQDPIKGLDVFIEAVSIVLGKRPEFADRVRVIMAGDGLEGERCKELRDKLGLEHVIEFPGLISDVPKLLQEFDIFVQPSLNEGISNTMLEAMASGLPVVATRVGGNPELITDGVEGSLVAAGDAGALAHVIEQYLDSPSLCSEHGAAARERAANEFSIEAMVGRYTDFYTSTMQL